MALTKITRGVIKANENYDTHNINSTGIVTAVTFTGNVTGVAATFTGDVSIGGTLTYQDVTNIDSVGVITARAGVDVNNGHIVLDSGYSLQWSDSHERIEQSDGKLEFFTNNTEKVTISGGSVGFGTDNPATDFHIHSPSSGSNSEILLTNGDTGSSATDGFKIALNTGSGGEIWNYENDYIRFGTNNDERLRIDSSGRVMIGTQTPGPTAGKHLTIADSANSGITIRSGTNAGGAILFEDDTADRGEIQYSHNGDYMRFKTAGSERLRINSGGFFNFNQANNNNLQGRVTIFDGGNFSTSSTLGSGDSDNIYLISDATSGNNVYGSSIAWSRVQYADRRVAAIANVQTSTDEDHVGLAFFTHPSADATANIEEKFRITHDGIHITNGVSNFYAAFRIANNQSYNWDIAVPNEGGYGNSFRCECGYNHYYTTSYGAHRSAWISTRGTSSNNMFDQDQSHSQAGYWTFSKPNNTTFRVTKTAGTYGGQGYGFIHVRYNYF